MPELTRKSITECKDANEIMAAGYDLGEHLDNALLKIEGRLPPVRKDTPPNFFNQYVKFAEELTDAPVEFHRILGYVVAGIILGRQVVLPWGNNNIYPNFYVATLAPSSIFRKSTALAIGARIIKRSNPNSILPSEFSLEKLLEILEERPQGVFIYYEFKSLLGLLSRDYMQGAKSFLTELYDCPPDYRRETKGIKVEIKDPCVSFITATTMEWFLDTIKSGDLEGGFLTRFLFVPVIKKDKTLAIPPKLDNDKLIMMDGWIEKIKEVKGEISFSDEAKKTYEKWYMNEEERISKNEGDFGSFSVRLQTYALKFAMLNAAVIEHTTTISERAMKEALEIIDWLMRHTERIIRSEISYTQFGKLIIKAKKRINGGKIRARDLLRYLNITARENEALIQTLVERDEVEVEIEKTKGRPTTWIIAK